MEQYQSGEARWTIPARLAASPVSNETGKQGGHVDDPPEPPPEKKVQSTPCS